MFRLRTDARVFFSKIEKSLSRQAPFFDMYYFCLLAGLATKRCVPELNTYAHTDLIDHFPGEYRARGELILSLFLATELERQQVEMTDKPAVHREVGRFLEPRAPSYLSSDGLHTMNSYSFAGCDVLREEWFEESPASLDWFLIAFQTRVASAMSSQFRADHERR